MPNLTISIMLGLAPLPPPSQSDTTRATSCSIRDVATIAVVLKGSHKDEKCQVTPDSLTMSGFTCSDCSFQFNSIVYNAAIRDSRWIDTEIVTLPIESGEINDLTIVRGHIRKLDISGAKLNRVGLYGGTIDTLIIRDGVVSDFRMHHARIGYVEFSNVTATGVTLEAHSGGHIVINGGTWSGLRLSHHFGQPPALRIQLAKLEHPYVGVEMAEAVDLRRLGLGAASLVLEQETHALDVRGTNRATAWWTEAQVVYGVFSRQLSEAGLGPAQRWMEFRMRYAELQTIESEFSRWVATRWHVDLRGKYGLFPDHILWFAFRMILLFACGYFLLGVLGFGWAGFTVVGLEGERLGRLVVIRFRWQKVFGYARHALFFSADRMLFGASRVFQFDRLLEEFRIAPTKYAAVGVGRFVGSVEGMMGIVLLVNLIQAILRTV